MAADQVEDATTVTLVNPPSDAEVEVTSNIARDDGSRSADLFDLLSSSSQISSNSEHSRNSANTSLLSRSSKETESEGSTPVSIGRRRRNKKESSTGDTSEEETVLPPKVSRTSRVSRGCPQQETRSSSQSSDNIQPSPSVETSQQCLERSSDSLTLSVYHTPPSKETNSNSFTTPVQMTSASDKKLHSLRSRKNAKTSSNTSEDRVSAEDTSESSSSGEILRQIAGKKAQVNAKNTELPSQSSLSPKKTRSRSRVSTPSDDATPVRRSARIESSTASSDSDKTPNTGRSASTDTGLRRSRTKKYSPTSSADDERVRSTRQRGRSSNKHHSQRPTTSKK